MILEMRFRIAKRRESRSENRWLVRTGGETSCSTFRAAGEESEGSAPYSACEVAGFWQLGWQRGVLRPMWEEDFFSFIGNSKGISYK